MCLQTVQTPEGAIHVPVSMVTWSMLMERYAVSNNALCVSDGVCVLKFRIKHHLLCGCCQCVVTGIFV